MARPKRPRSGPLFVFVSALVDRTDPRDFEMFAAFDHSDARSRCIAYYAQELGHTLRSNEVSIRTPSMSKENHDRLLALADRDGFIGSYRDGSWSGPAEVIAA